MFSRLMATIAACASRKNAASNARLRLTLSKIT
jgi:hypothetical protein